MPCGTLRGKSSPTLPAAYLSSTVPKSAPAKAPECLSKFFPEDQEESTPMTEKQEAGPIKMVSPRPSDSDDSTTEEEQKKDQVEHENTTFGLGSS